MNTSNKRMCESRRHQLTFVGWQITAMSICCFLATFPQIGHSLISKSQSLSVRKTRNILHSISKSSPDEEIIPLIRDSDRGIRATAGAQTLIRHWMDAKAIEYKQTKFEQNIPATLEDPNIFGNYDVSYVGVNKASKQADRGNPAGGKFRGNIGRFVYNSIGVFQHIVKDESKIPAEILVINFIHGYLFNLIYLGVILYGYANPIDDDKRLQIVADTGNELSPDGTAQVAFEAPLIVVGNPLKKFGGFTIRIGPPSSVVLDTTYISDQMRLARGSRGSEFVFLRTTDPIANAWKEFVSVRPFRARRVGIAMLLTSCLLFAFKATIRHPLISFLPPVVSQVIRKVFKALGFTLTFFGLFLTFSRGGIERD